MSGAKTATRAPLGEVTNTVNGKETPAKGDKNAKSTDEVEKIDLTKTPDVSKSTPKPSAPASNSSKKRSRPDDDAEVQEESAPMFTIDLDSAMTVQDADRVRRKLRRITDNKEMTVKGLCETLQVSSTSYSNFMRQSGPTKGTGSDVFMNAWGYLAKREMVEIKLPVAKKAKKDSDPATAKSKTGKADTAIADVHLDGEEEDAVPVYATCDAIRRQITAHLKKTGTSQVQFCRDLSAQLHTEETDAAIKPNTLTTFRSKHGANGGATSKVFYAAYVLFEKQRVAEGKAKSKARLEMEEVWGSKGMERDHDSSTA
ncbi:hypothetical protein LTR95_003670 [Oleoguttula sp. CCFEE 5521]